MPKEYKFFDVECDHGTAYDFAKLRAFITKKIRSNVQEVKLFPPDRKNPEVRLRLVCLRYAPFDMVTFQREKLGPYGLHAVEILPDGSAVTLEKVVVEPATIPTVTTTTVTTLPIAVQRQPQGHFPARRRQTRAKAA